VGWPASEFYFQHKFSSKTLFPSVELEPRRFLFAADKHWQPSGRLAQRLCAKEQCRMSVHFALRCAAQLVACSPHTVCGTQSAGQSLRPESANFRLPRLMSRGPFTPLDVHLFSRTQVIDFPLGRPVLSSGGHSLAQVLGPAARGALRGVRHGRPSTGQRSAGAQKHNAARP